MNKKIIRIVFFGTPEFAVPALQSLLDSNYTIVGVVTRVDRPVGRKQQLTPPPVKILAETKKIKIFQPEKLNDVFIQTIKDLKPNLFVIVAYGKILPQALLDIPKFGSINIHPSLLPRYRGPSPLQATILSGDTKTGVSIMLIDEEMDHGAILARFKIKDLRLKNYNYETLGKELFELGAKHLAGVIEKYIAGEIKPQEQDHNQATFTKLIKKEDGLIDWHKPASYIERMTRAYTPWPSTYAKLKVKNEKLKTKELNIKLISVSVSKEKIDLKPGTTFQTNNDELGIACGDGSILLVNKIQPSGKSPMTGKEFLRGHPTPRKK